MRRRVPGVPIGSGTGSPSGGGTGWELVPVRTIRAMRGSAPPFVMRGNDPSGCCSERSAYSPRAFRQQQATDAEQRGLTTVAAMCSAQACHRGARDDRAAEARADRIGRVTLRLLNDVPNQSARSLSSRLSATQSSSQLEEASQFKHLHIWRALHGELNRRTESRYDTSAPSWLTSVRNDGTRSLTAEGGRQMFRSSPPEPAGSSFRQNVKNRQDYWRNSRGLNE